MPNELVSVIMPAYNAEKTLLRAVESVLVQTWQSWELIIVDDGSSDSTADIAHRSADRDASGRVRVLRLGANGGLPNARNRGIAQARGSWVTFLDADDEYLRDHLSTMMSARGVAVDVVVCDHALVAPDGTRTIRRVPSRRRRLTGRQAVVATLHERLSPFAWDKLYRRTILLPSHYATDVTRGEDAIGTLRAFARSRSVTIVDHVGVLYYVGETSMSWGSLTPLREVDALRSHQASLAEALDPGKDLDRGLAIAHLTTCMNAVNQVVRHRSGAERTREIRKVTARVSMRTILKACTGNPSMATAALAARTVPPLYAWLYRRHARRTYGI